MSLSQSLAHLVLNSRLGSRGRKQQQAVDPAAKVQLTRCVDTSMIDRTDRHTTFIHDITWLHVTSHAIMVCALA